MVVILAAGFAVVAMVVVIAGDSDNAGNGDKITSMKAK